MRTRRPIAAPSEGRGRPTETAGRKVPPIGRPALPQGPRAATVGSSMRPATPTAFLAAALCAVASAQSVERAAPAPFEVRTGDAVDLFLAGAKEIYPRLLAGSGS